MSMTHLLKLLAKLLRLKYFSCNNCCGNAGIAGAQLPHKLPQAVPELTHLHLMSNGLVGTLPDDRGNWTSLQFLDLTGIRLTGTLPASFAGMKGLMNLDVRYNQLTGTLPAEFGERGTMRPDIEFDIHSTQINSSVPSSWSYFASGCLRARRSQMHGCRPDKLTLCVDEQEDMFELECRESALPLCSNSSVETVSLRSLKRLLQGAVPDQQGGLTSWSAAILPCDGWLGVKCDKCDNTSGDVNGLNLTALGIRTSSLSLLSLVISIANLTWLDTLVVPGLGLSGPLDDPSTPSIGMHMFRRLRHLDISSNPGITRTLPSSWFALKQLQTLDIWLQHHRHTSGNVHGTTGAESFPCSKLLRHYWQAAA
jgi:hypothetical protein